MTLLTRARYWLAAASVLIVAALAPGLSQLRLDNSFEIWFPEDDPALLTYRAHLEEFGNDEVVVLAVGLPEGEAHNTSRVGSLRSLHDVLENLEGVAAVMSYASLPEFDPEDDFLDAESERLNALFVDSSGSTYKLLVTMDYRADLELLRNSLLTAIDGAARIAFPDNTGVWMAGTGVILDALNTETIAQSAVFVPLSYLCIIGLLGWLTRSWRWTGLAVVVLSGANIGMFGLMGWMDRPITMITMALPPIALVVTISSVLHLQRAVRIGEALKPVIYSCLTSAGGFFSLAFADMAITRDYGLFAAVVILLSLLITLTGAAFTTRRRTPVGAASAAIPITPEPRQSPPHQSRLNQKYSRYLNYATHHKHWILMAAVITTALALHQITRLEVDTHSLGFLPQDHRAQVDSRQIEKVFGPYVPLEFVVALDESQDAHSTGVMRQIHDLQTGVTRRVDGVGDSFSYVDAAFANELVAQYAPGTDISGIEPQRWIDNSGTRVRVTWVVPMSSAGELEVLTNKVLDAGRELLPRGASLTATGYLPLYSRLIDHVISDQVKSLAVALIVVFGLIACWFRDLRTVLIALAINLPPIVFLLGTMALLNVPLDVATITVAPAMLGLIVDDSMHLLYHYRQRISEGVKLEAALAANFATVGRTLILTSAVLVAGFGLLGFSSVSSISSNGLLMALTVVFALAVDLLLLPPITALLQTAPRGVSAVRHA